ncbi:MAG TPA: isocitrate lyase/phosphoenolpyruvate mutase family protein [Chitinophagaceae bacterium]|jgi:2-methylisocitrate lyase-like PEP mutase family enzyme
MANPIQSQSHKTKLFKSLHERPGCFVIPNAWNAGSAKILTAMGFEAIATTSGGLAFSLGLRDGTRDVTREDNLANAKEIVSATALPVSCDFENGYSHSAAGLAQSIELAAETGLAGASIEDATGTAGSPIYELKEATERVRAAVEAANKLPFPFLITARAENFLHGRNDLKDTIKRLQHFEEAGAHVLFAPGLKSKEDILTVLKEIHRPLNVIMGFAGAGLAVAELADMGVKRISVGSALCRAAFGSFIQAAREIKEKGTFQFAESTISYKEISNMF